MAIDRTAKFAFVELHEKADRPTSARFPEALIAAVPYRIHTVLTDNGLQFTDLPRIGNGQTNRYRAHPFSETCRAKGIDHRLTKPNHPWTTDVIDKSVFAETAVFSASAQATSWRRVGMG